MHVYSQTYPTYQSNLSKNCLPKHFQASITYMTINNNNNYLTWEVLGRLNMVSYNMNAHLSDLVAPFVPCHSVCSLSGVCFLSCPRDRPILLCNTHDMDTEKYSTKEITDIYQQT